MENERKKIPIFSSYYFAQTANTLQIKYKCKNICKYFNEMHHHFPLEIFGPRKTSYNCGAKEGKI